MMIHDHGDHQPVWEALIDFAAEHSTVDTCNAHAGRGGTCPENARLLDAQMALIAAGDMRAADELIRWMIARTLDTLRVTAIDAGKHGAMVGFDSRKPASLLAARLMHAAGRGDEDTLTAQLTYAVNAPHLLGEVIFEITAALAKALILRHQQLSAGGIQ